MDIVFENNIYVDLPDVLGVELDGANSPLLGFLPGLGASLSRRPLESQPLRFVAETRGVLKQNIQDSSFSSTFSFLFVFVSF